jgi:hypothetical protein
MLRLAADKDGSCEGRGTGGGVRFALPPVWPPARVTATPLSDGSGRSCQGRASVNGSDRGPRRRGTPWYAR